MIIYNIKDFILLLVYFSFIIIFSLLASSLEPPVSPNNKNPNKARPMFNKMIRQLKIKEVNQRSYITFLLLSVGGLE